MVNLIAATYLGKNDEVKNLIENENQDVNQTDDYGDTALHAAAAKGRFDLVKYLVEKNASINAKNKVGSTPLHKAMLSNYDQLDIVRFLLSKGADANAKNDAGFFPDDLAKEARIMELVQGKNTVSIKVPLPKDLHGRIIGKGGSKLKELRLETRTTILIPSPEEKTNDITIKGRPEAVELAKKKVLALTTPKSVYRSDNFPEDATDTITTRLQIPKDRHRIIIGKSGKNIQDVLDSAAVEIVIPTAEEKEDAVKITGRVEEVHVAVKTILEFIGNDRSSAPKSKLPTPLAQYIDNKPKVKEPRRDKPNNNNNSGKSLNVTDTFQFIFGDGKQRRGGKQPQDDK